MRKIKLTFLIVALIFAILLVFSIESLSLKKTANRNIAENALSQDLKVRIKNETNCLYDEYNIIQYSCDLTGELLKFDRRNDIANGKANCIGYAQLTSAICNYVFKLHGLPYKARPVVGQVFCFGINLTALSQKILPVKYRPFFKDHDFVEINLGKKIYYVDSSLHDLTGFRYEYQIDKQ